MERLWPIRLFHNIALGEIIFVFSLQNCENITKLIKITFKYIFG